MSKIKELYGQVTTVGTPEDWQTTVEQQACPFLQRKCGKTRKSRPEITIGTCTVTYGKDYREIIICPFRFLERRQIFIDCLHLLTAHEPGNELHIVPEVSIPGGNVDYFLASVRNNSVKDFVGIEIQSLDTTGSVWPERQRFLRENAIALEKGDQSADATTSFGLNWKMSAKTILVQLHHKVQTFEEMRKHLVLVLQDHFMTYIQSEFQFAHINQAHINDSAQLHVYALEHRAQDASFHLQLTARLSTNADGIAQSLGLQASHIMEIDEITKVILDKVSPKTLLTLT